MRGRRSVDERRDELVGAAIRILATDGLPALTTRRITEEAGVALGSFHYVFSGKQELLRAVAARVADGIGEVLRDSITDRSADLATVMRDMIDGFWYFVEATPDLQLAQYELTVHALREPDLAGLAAWQYERCIEAVSGAARDLPGLPSGPDFDDFVRFVIAIMDGLVLAFVVERDVEAARQRLAVLHRLIEASDVDQLVAGPVITGRV